MTDRRFLIVNGDDFGQSAGVNRGIITAHENGILTSASLMVRWPDALAAAEYARDHPNLSVGLHLDLGEWTLRDGEWRPLYAVVDENDPDAIEKEIAAQCAAFRDLLRREPTHLDSHQHVHLTEPVSSIVRRIANKMGIPVRGQDPRVRYCGHFYGQEKNGTPWPHGITCDALLGILHGLKAGSTELGCHPAADADVDSMYRNERLQELATLCDSRVRRAIEDLGIELCSFHALRTPSHCGTAE